MVVRIRPTGHIRLLPRLALVGLLSSLLSPVVGASSAAATWEPGPARLAVLAGTGGDPSVPSPGFGRLATNLAGPLAVAVAEAPGANTGEFAIADRFVGSVVWQDAAGVRPGTALQDLLGSVGFGAWWQVFPQGTTDFVATGVAVSHTHRTTDGFTVYATDPVTGHLLGGGDGSSLLAGTGRAPGIPVPGPASASPLHANAVATDSRGTVYATDPSADSLVAIDPVTELLRLVAGTGTAVPLTDPRAVAVGPDDTLHLIDGNAVVRLAADGTKTVLAGPGSDHPVDRPTALAVGVDGTLYVADGHTVTSRDPAGVWTLVAGRTHGTPVSGDAVDSPLGQPTGLAVRGDGTLAISDREARQVLTVTPDQPVYGIPLDPGTHRLAGPDRVQTAVLASRRLAPFDHTATSVVLARADSYADSLAGARLASTLSAPLFLTSGDHLTPELRTELDRVLTRSPRVYVLGDSRAVPVTIDEDVYRLRPFRDTERLAGYDRFDTAAQIADRVEWWGGADDETTPLFLVNGWNYPDGLAVSALAARTGGQVLLTDGDHLPERTARFLADHDPSGSRTVPVGGAAADAVENDIPDQAYENAIGNAVVGADRYETSALLASAFAAEAGDPVTETPVGLATGQNWPDALVGAAAMGVLEGPLLLTPTEHLAPSTTSALRSLTTGPGRISTLAVFGGTDRVSDSALREAAVFVRP